MNKDQIARLQRHRKVKQTLADYAAAVASVPAFAALGTQYLAQLGLLDGAASRNAVTSEGVTLAKNTAGTALIGRLVRAANALYLFYKAATPAPNLTEAAKMPLRPSDYRRQGELELATTAADLAQRITTHKTKLISDYGLNAANVAALTADAQAFGGLLGSGQLAIDAGKIKGTTTRLALSALNRFLKDDLRAGMELLQENQPAAYAALREASQVDDAAYRKKKAKRAAGKAAGDEAVGEAANQPD